MVLFKEVVFIFLFKEWFTSLHFQYRVINNGIKIIQNIYIIIYKYNTFDVKILTDTENMEPSYQPSQR